MSNNSAAQAAWSRIEREIDALNTRAIRLAGFSGPAVARKLAHLHQVRRIWLACYFVFPLPPAICERDNPDELTSKLGNSALALKYLAQRTANSSWWMAWMKPSVRCALWYVRMHENHHLADYERQLRNSTAE